MTPRDAHRKVWEAIRRGKLVRQPCEVCGRKPWCRNGGHPGAYQSVIAHHDDYDRPLDVRWLCTEHHAAHHRSQGAYVNNGRPRKASA